MAKIKQEAIKKKKKWYSILAPKQFNNVVIGDGYVEDINLLKGRIFSVNLMSVTNDLKKQNINGSFKVEEIKGDHVVTNIIGYNITSSYIKRMSKKSKTKVDDSFKAKSSDGINLVVKPMILTKNKINNSICTSLRLKSREVIIDFLSKKSYDDFIKAVITNSIQKELKDRLNKVTPLVSYIVRSFKRLD